MATTAPMIQYRQELILGFEERKSILLQSVTQEAVIKGNTATFLITSSANDEAVTRGTNGLVPYRSEDLTQVACTLVEKHAAYRKTGFNIFQSQGDQRRSMQEASMAVINREINKDIITQLNTATNDTGTTAKASLGLVMHAQTILGNNAAMEGQITALISPAFFGYIAQDKAFTNIEYAPRKMFDGSTNLAFTWGPIDFIVYSKVPGVGTSAEKCFLYNKMAMGYAMDSSGMKINVGYNEEHDYSFSDAIYYGGAKLLQNSGVVVINHDASGFAAS
jgi:hypothetical protein